MHYNLPGGRLIKSENAAKPATQPSRFLVELLADLPQVSSTLDYGCGKLRYCDQLLRTTGHLAVVDSEIQISRDQILLGQRTSIRKLFRDSNSVSVFNTSEIAVSLDLYERAFCINVLSAIPFMEERRKLICQILKKLKLGAHCLFVVQYRNSDFTRMSKLKTAEDWEDGFILKSLRGYSFYALITPSALVAIVEWAGFKVVTQRLHEGSVYMWAQRPELQSGETTFDL